MKLRTGFVSNSSSSSFIVSAKKGVNPIVTIEIELPTDDILSSIEELNRYFLEHYASDEKTIEELLAGEEAEYMKDDYETCLKEIKKGNVIHIGRVANDDGDATSNLLYDCGIGDNLKNGKVIQDCQG